MTNKSILVVMLYNICVLGAFLALAIMVQQWWIILFSLLFLSFPEVVYRYYRICDKCGRQSRPMKTYDEALAQATKDGWVHYDDGNLDYCPTCKSKMNKEN